MAGLARAQRSLAVLAWTHNPRSWSVLLGSVALFYPAESDRAGRVDP